MTKKEIQSNKKKKKNITFDDLKIAYHTYMKVLKRFENDLYLIDASHFIGYILISSLLCEIALKALLIYENKKSTKHNLYLLFKELNADMQQALAILNEYSLIDFEKILKENSEHFIQWRYFYEMDCENFDMEFINKFTRKMEFFLDELKTDNQ